LLNYLNFVNSLVLPNSAQRHIHPCILGILLLFLRRLPEAPRADLLAAKELPADQKLAAKGLPVEALNKIRSAFGIADKKSEFCFGSQRLKPMPWRAIK